MTTVEHASATLTVLKSEVVNYSFDFTRSEFLALLVGPRPGRLDDPEMVKAATALADASDEQVIDLFHQGWAHDQSFRARFETWVETFGCSDVVGSVVSATVDGANPTLRHLIRGAESALQAYVATGETESLAVAMKYLSQVTDAL